MSEHQTMKSIGQMMPSPKSDSCPKHGDFQSIAMPGHALKCPKCAVEQDMDKAQKAAAQTRREARMKSAVYRSGIPPRFMSKTFDGFDPADEKQARVLRICKAYAERFDERHEAGGGLVMCGTPGTGKTHLAAAIGNHLMAAGRSALFASVLAAVRRVKQTYNKGSTETEHDAIAKFYEPDLLMLDEVGVQFGSEAERLILFEIINGRYERVLPTILISNLPENELGAFIGDRVMDRMKEGGGVVLAFDWESKRHTIKTASRDMPAWIND